MSRTKVVSVRREPVVRDIATYCDVLLFCFTGEGPERLLSVDVAGPARHGVLIEQGLGREATDHCRALLPNG